MKLKRILSALVAGLALAGSANAYTYNAGAFNSGTFHPFAGAGYTYFDFGMTFANLVNDATQDISDAHLTITGSNVHLNQASVDVFNGVSWVGLGYLQGPTTQFWLGNSPGLNYLESHTLSVRVNNANLAGMSGASLTAHVFAVPEPSGVAMLLAGIGAIGFMSRRRKSV
jgi:hypothetical protein